MGESTKKENEWLDKATAAAIAGARKIALNSSGLPPMTPIGRLSDSQWSWVVAGVIFAWVQTRVEQAIEEGLDQERAVRMTGLTPSPCDVAVGKFDPASTRRSGRDRLVGAAFGVVEEHHDELLDAGVATHQQARARLRPGRQDPAATETGGVRRWSPFLNVRFVMTLQPLLGVDGIRALRWVLKGLLRQHGMKCVSVREEKR